MTMKHLRHILSVGMLIALVSSASAQSWLTNGLVAYYPLNGNANDSSGNGLNLTNSGTTFITDRFNRSNSAVDITGLNSNGKFLRTTNLIPIAGNSPRTISLWFYARETLNKAMFSIFPDC